MKREILIREIVRLCFDYGVIISEREVQKNINDGLEEEAFIESLINKITIKAKTARNIDINRVIELLLELERIRLELEYRDYNKPKVKNKIKTAA